MKDLIVYRNVKGDMTLFFRSISALRQFRTMLNEVEMLYLNSLEEAKR